MTDQYGNKVPSDLVLLPTSELLEDNDIEVVLKAPWYKVNYAPNHYCTAASFKAIDELSEDDAMGLIKTDTVVELIDTVLHRYSDEDGFYHA